MQWIARKVWTSIHGSQRMYHVATCRFPFSLEGLFLADPHYKRNICKTAGNISQFKINSQSYTTCNVFCQMSYVRVSKCHLSDLCCQSSTSPSGFSFVDIESCLPKISFARSVRSDKSQALLANSSYCTANMKAAALVQHHGNPSVWSCSAFIIWSCHCTDSKWTIKDIPFIIPYLKRFEFQCHRRTAAELHVKSCTQGLMKEVRCLPYVICPICQMIFAI